MEEVERKHKEKRIFKLVIVILIIPITLLIIFMILWLNAGTIALTLYYKYDIFGSLSLKILRTAPPEILVDQMLKEPLVNGKYCSGPDLLSKRGRDLLPELKQKLHDPDPEVRRLALRTIGLLESKAVDAFAEVKETLQDPDPLVYITAIWVIGQIIPNNSGIDTVPVLKPFLTADTIAEARIETIRSLAKTTNIKRVLPELIRLINVGDPFEETIVLSYLLEIKPFPQEIKKKIIPKLESENTSLKIVVIKTLMASEDSSLVPVLKEKLATEEHIIVRQHYTAAINKLRKRGQERPSQRQKQKAMLKE